MDGVRAVARLAAILIVGLLAVVAEPAVACSEARPPNLQDWLNDPAYPMYLGRVDRIEELPPYRDGRHVLTDGVAHISRLETIQGKPSSHAAETRGVLSVGSADGSLSPPPCFSSLSMEAGDLVVVVEAPYSSVPLVFSRVVANAPAFTPYFEKHQ